MKTYPSLWLLLTGAMAVGCDGTQPGPQAIENRITLQNFGSCGELEAYIEDTAVRYMRGQIDAQKEDGWRFGGPVRGDAEAGAPAADSKSNGPSAYTKTNTQVAGVDEADFMKNDGTRIFVLTGNTLYAAQSWPPQNMALAGQLKIEGYPSQMYLDEKNRLVIFSSIYTRYPFDAEVFGGRPCGAWDCYYSYANTTKVTVVQADGLALRVAAEHYLPGSYANSRRIGSSVRIVLSDSFRMPPNVRYYPDYSPGLYEDKALLNAALEGLKARNETLIRQATLDQWLPRSWRRGQDGKSIYAPYDCRDFSRSNAPVELGLLTIATLNLDRDDGAVARTSVLGQVHEIYASKDSLYVANYHWWWWPAPGQTNWTYLHKFDITDPNRARYVASGGVEGTIVDQFAMDEHDKYFRVATTIQRRVPDEKNPQNRWGRVVTTSRVSVLGERGGFLDVIGKSSELAERERITSARFVGDKGYVVTFEQIDPLFTFDLSNPQSPRKVGELKIPGFSTYIHPLDDGHLLTMGIYQPDPMGGPVDWRQRSLQLSLFDVSDLARPTQTFTQKIGTAYSSSEATWEHKAFNYFPERKLLAIPFTDWEPCRAAPCPDYWTGFTSEIRVFDIDLQKGITPRGAVSMKDMYVTESDNGWTWYWRPYVRRSVMVTDKGQDFVYAVSDAGLRVADLADLSRPLSTVRFPKTR